MAEAEIRPNIRIEISNNLADSMEVDEDDKTAGREEGEIWEESSTLPKEAPEIVPKFGNKIWTNISSNVNVFDGEEQIKLQERAKRFALKPDEINNFTDEHVQQLHASLGITEENTINLRFEAIHMRGTEGMDTEDVLDYFAKYGPFSVEWIDDSCCNVVWIDSVSTARALHYTSQPINNLPVRGLSDPFMKDFESDLDKQESGKSILLRNANREVQLADDDDNEILGNKENKFEGAVDIADISCPIPPGYWRFGKPHKKSKTILLRFAFKTDKKPYKTEKFSGYYRKVGSLRTADVTKQFKGIFDRNKEIQSSEVENKNPWRGLAENWDNDAQFREKEYVDPVTVLDNKPVLKNSGLLERLGFKRAHESENEEEVEKIKKKIKIPRMRMYADEEEQKIKRKKQLMAVKSVKVEVQEKDLRSLLGDNSARRHLKQDDEVEVIDLGAKLKNRTRNSERIPVPIIKDDERITRSIVNDRMKPVEKHGRSYERRMHADHHEKTRRKSYVEEDESFRDHKPRSKVAVVIKTQKKPAVASTVWSRITEKGRFKTGAENNEKRYSSSESNSNSSSSSGSSNESENSDYDELPKTQTKTLRRPGFTHIKTSIAPKVSDHKSPLRIEINNEHFRRK